MVDNHLIKMRYVNRCLDSIAIDGDRWTASVQVQFPSPATWKRFSYKEACHWKRDLDFVSRCIENVLDLRTIDLQLSRSLNFTRRKFFLSIWWDWKDIVYYKLFSQDETINFGKYCNQLDKLKHAIAEKQPKLVNWNELKLLKCNELTKSLQQNRMLHRL